MSQKVTFVSVMGDSISTYEGFNPPGYSVFYDGQRCEMLGLKSVYDTWWAKVNQYLHAYICINNSYSGSRVSGTSFPSGRSIERTSYLHNGTRYPDIILVYLGINDFARGVKIAGSNSRDRDSCFFDSYADMLTRIRINYPLSRIICGTLMKTTIKNCPDWEFPDRINGISLEDYNSAIKSAARISNVDVADLFSYGYAYETLDGTHPTVNGHIQLAEAWKEYFRKTASV